LNTAFNRIIVRRAACVDIEIRSSPNCQLATLEPMPAKSENERRLIGCPTQRLGEIDSHAMHGGMTELEGAALTDGQGRALSADKSRAYEGYVKRTIERALAGDP
jgi:hypothetical protein